MGFPVQIIDIMIYIIVNKLTTKKNNGIVCNKGRKTCNIVTAEVFEAL